MRVRASDGWMDGGREGENTDGVLRPNTGDGIYHPQSSRIRGKKKKQRNKVAGGVVVRGVRG